MAEDRFFIQTKEHPGLMTDALVIIDKDFYKK